MSARNVQSASRPGSRGMTLIEIMVGVAIGLIGIVAIFQAVAVWTKHSQTTSSGGDAQVAGTLALFNIERDLKQAGHGFGKAQSAVMGCPISVTDSGPPARPTFTVGLRPVDIAASAGGAPDTISVLYGDSAFYVDESLVTAASATGKTLQRRGGFKNGDLAVFAVNAGASAATATCQLIEITDDTDPDGFTVHHTASPYTSFYAAGLVTPRFNTPASAPGALTGTLYNLGPQPVLNTWSIVGNRVLTRTEALQVVASPPTQIAEGVINLKAEFGYDTNGNGQIDDSPGNAEWLTALPLGADWRRVLAIRVAVLVRSRQFERSVDPASSAAWPVTPTASNPYYFGDPVNRKFKMTDVNGGPNDSFGNTDADPNNWRYYRYRVYERVIPLRNMLWGTLS